MIWDKFSIFRTNNCAMVCGTRAPVAARAFADVARGKRLSKFPKFFILFASNSKRCNVQMSHFHESGFPSKTVANSPNK